MLEELVRWWIFSIAIAVLPLLFKFVRQLTWGRSITFAEFFSKGELLLISFVISAGAIGKLFGCGKTLVLPSLIAGGACIILSCTAVFWFAELSAVDNGSHHNPSQSFNNRSVAIGSIILFAFTLLVTSFCVIVEANI